MAKEDIVKYQFDKLTAEEQQAIASMGGKASVEARRKRKTFKEQTELLLSLPLKNKEAKTKLKKLGIDVDNLDNQMAMLVVQFNKALKGDMQAITFFRDIVGEKPQEKINVDGNINTTNPLKNLSTDEIRKAIELMKNDNKE